MNSHEWDAEWKRKGRRRNMTAEQMTGERKVTISFICSGFDAKSLEDAFDDYWEAEEESEINLRCEFASLYLQKLVGEALYRKELEYSIIKEK